MALGVHRQPIFPLIFGLALCLFSAIPRIAQAQSAPTALSWVPTTYPSPFATPRGHTFFFGRYSSFAPEFPLAVSFLDNGYKLYFGHVIDEEHVRDQMHDWRALYLIAGKNMAEVTTLAQLRGCVTIDTPAKALAYARLGSGPPWIDYRLAYIRLRPDFNGCEIIDTNEITKSLYYGDARDARNARQLFGGGEAGVLSPDERSILGIPRASCVKSSDGYLIYRTFVTFNIDDNNVANYTFNFAKTVEWVGPHGEYALRQVTPIHVPSLPNIVSWRPLEIE
ncbi:MAG TPA: hypothetical protein VFW40_12305 [Capsulimonadaceae bacterium]|nr:hypothetical protein [Capsulimonadaceae bacterium]